MRLIDLKQKEIINICTCSSMGCPADVEFNSRTGRITALVVPGAARFCGLRESRRFPCLSLSAAGNQAPATARVGALWGRFCLDICPGRA